MDAHAPARDPAGAVTLTDVAAELYAVPPAGFVAARTARARQLRADGDRELATRVAALRKPSLAAWAVNLLVRHRPAEVEGLLALGAQLLEAQTSLAGGELRELDRRRHALMAAVRAQAHALAVEAGQPLADAVDVPLDSTLRAAMTDAAAAAAVRSGLLVQDLNSTGFGPVDVGDAVAVPGAPPLTGAPPAAPAPGGAGVPVEGDADDAVALPVGARRGARATPRRSAVRTTPSREDAARAEEDRVAARRATQERAEAAREAARRRDREEAERDLAGAEERAADADAALAAAKAAVTEAGRRRTDLAAKVERLAAELGAAQAAAQAVSVDERHARTAREAAAQAVTTAQRRVRGARERVDRLS